ncbi:MAG: hypothetical protein JNM75_03855 [Rhodospirillales bacterium]|nr:hypothetical protein [Rhodospirillales bacterium]
MSRAFLVFAFAAMIASPIAGRAASEIAKPGAIVMNHLPNPVYFDGANTPDRETAIAAYRREIKDMIAIGSYSVALDGFNNPRDKTRFGYWKEAVRRHNEEGGVKFCFFLLADFDPAVWPAETIRSVYQSLVDSPYYCAIQGKPALATYRGEQKSASWFLSEVLNPLRADGDEPFFLVFFRGTSTQAVISNYLKVWRNAFYKVGAYRFSGNTPQATLNGEISEKPLYDNAGFLYIPGFGTSYWAACSSKTNAGVYFEHDGFEGLDLLWKKVNPGGPLNGDYVMLTVWNDVGEDNFFSRAKEPLPFYRNPDLDTWTHRGFHEFSRSSIRAFRKLGSENYDWLYWAYRQHPKDLPAPKGDECVEYGNKLSFTGNIQDVIYVTTVLKAPAELQVTLGNSSFVQNQPEGIAHVRIPWNDERGRPVFTLSRGGVVIMSRPGDLEITDKPIGRDGEGTRNFNTYADVMRR